MKNLLIILFSSILLTNCVSYRADYVVGMVGVDSPSGSNDISKDSVVFQNKILESYNFEDDYIDISWSFDYSELDFELINKTNKTIKIIWDEAAYVDENGNSSNIMHNGVKYSNRNESQKPSIVVKNGKLNDAILPTSKAYYSTPTQYTSGSWVHSPLFPRVVELSEKEVIESCEGVIGLEVKVLLPIEIEGITYEYIFTFRVEDLTIITYQVI